MTQLKLFSQKHAYRLGDKVVTVMPPWKDTPWGVGRAGTIVELTLDAGDPTYKVFLEGGGVIEDVYQAEIARVEP